MNEQSWQYPAREEKKKTKLSLNHLKAFKSLKFVLLDKAILFFIAKPLFPAEPAIPSAGVLGLGSKLYPSNKQHMLDLTWFM